MTSLESNEKKTRIVIVGGGFAGLNLAQNLYKTKNYHITLVDKNNYNYFTPLLYQVATSFLDPSSISYPFRKLFRDKNINFRMAEFLRVDPATQTIYLSDGELQYDQLVFAAGAKTNFYGIESIEKNAISLKGIDDALKMRNALLTTLELAAKATDLAERRKLLTIVVAGGGPTGVEVAGMLAEMKSYILKKDYPELKNAKGAIYIVDGSENLLSPMSDKTHSETKKAMLDLGVQVKLKTRVADYTDGIVRFADGDAIEAGTLIWAAGITANVFEGIPLASLGVGKRMKTNEFNQVEGFENIWAIGDISVQITDPAYPHGHPQLAQVAIQQGVTLAKNFLAVEKGKAMKAFKYFDKGEMAIVGRHHAVVDLFKHKVHLSGFAALFIWLFIHLVSLVNYNNKVRTLYSWAVAFITRDQALRMIFRP
ncbi:NAD(P)/FAD-dependent oxidoreductase [Mucilaginibacter jinjuensis]|uniref:NADH:ubiquinone reductase (non-electrogenic) n=1 Tax=Mucilaginibacter jinjuensis TaxID=1176721 RepID=A0ABY7T0R2_9SPHI|nr:NAD(P)/FAD-dependent oxidoreductase [Mucilaginibacter jinjuensis]WCT10006.1 NAD(P)/FAD-dependent oxidoreductase [Mucilaginibacter jinjuensis]